MHLRGKTIQVVFRVLRPYLRVNGEGGAQSSEKFCAATEDFDGGRGCRGCVREFVCVSVCDGV